MSALTKKAAEFVEANKQSLVVYGAATHVPGEQECPENCTGVRYTLEDGRTFTLKGADLEGVDPHWKLS